MERMRVCVWAWGFVSLQPSQVGDMVTAAHGSGVVGLARLMSWLGSGASAAVCAWWLAARWPPAGRGGRKRAERRRAVASSRFFSRVFFWVGVLRAICVAPH